MRPLRRAATAVALAAALGARELALVAEAGGVFRNLADPASRLAELDRQGAEAGVQEGWIAGGMRPKLEAGFDALARGVASVRICPPAGLADADAGTRLVHP